jgi:hypothetical protein
MTAERRGEVFVSATKAFHQRDSLEQQLSAQTFFCSLLTLGVFLRRESLAKRATMSKLETGSASYRARRAKRERAAIFLSSPP